MKRFLIIYLISLSFFACNTKKKDEEVKVDTSEKDKKVKAEISEMVLKYNANESWLNTLTQLDSSGLPIKTINIQQAFEETSIRPYLFHVSFDDIFKEEEKYIATFQNPNQSLEFLLSDEIKHEGSFSSLYSFRFHFELSCSEELIQKLLNEQKNYHSNNFAIITRVHEIQKLKFRFEAVPSGDEEAYIEVEPSRAFLMRGELIDFVCTGDTSLGIY